MLFIFNVFFLSRQMIHCLTIYKFILKKITPQMHPNICPIYIYSIPSVHLQNILNNCDCNSCILIGRLVCESGRSPTRLTGSSVEDKRCNPGSRGCREFYGQWWPSASPSARTHKSTSNSLLRKQGSTFWESIDCERRLLRSIALSLFKAMAFSP